MKKTLTNLTGQAVSVAVKTTKGSLESITIPARQTVQIEESQMTPDMLIKIQRGKVSLS